MFTNHRKTIGVFISQINIEYQERLCKGIVARAQELDYNVIFFTNFGGYGQLEYDQGELQIADLPNYVSLDGIIIVRDTIVVENLEQRIKDYIKERTTCPVVTVRRKDDDYYNVLLDDNKVLEEIIRHFIEVHGFTLLNFLAGPKEHPDSQKRLACYKRVLAEYDIPIEEERIYYGDFWKEKGKEAVSFWLSSNLKKPEAIICASDYMAITVAEELEKMGISVPDDIAISGCDNLMDSSEFVPSITTAEAPIEKMGMEAVSKINRIHQGHKEPQITYMDSKAIFRESCGCDYNPDKERKECRKHSFRINNELSMEVLRNAYMSADLVKIRKLDEMNKRLRYYVYENKGFTDFYMCMYKDWQSIEEGIEYIRDEDEEIIMEVGIKNSVDYSKVRFSRQYLIPPEFNDDKPLVYYVAILHYQSVNFGYVAIAYEKNQTYMKTFHTWMINVSNVLENIRIHNELNRLVYKLEDMYIRDELTGLYNRRGLEILGEKYIKRAVEKNGRIMILTADLDKLKEINDNYGHAGGDIALRVVADALTFAADDDEICVRFGGDEFSVIGLEYDEDKAHRFIRRFIEKINSVNQSGKNKFNIYISYGWDILTPNEDTTIEESMGKADDRMYRQKREKEFLRLRANLL